MAGINSAARTSIAKAIAAAGSDFGAALQGALSAAAVSDAAAATSALAAAQALAAGNISLSDYSSAVASALGVYASPPLAENPLNGPLVAAVVVPVVVFAAAASLALYVLLSRGGRRARPAAAEDHRLSAHDEAAAPGAGTIDGKNTSAAAKDVDDTAPEPGKLESLLDEEAAIPAADVLPAPLVSDVDVGSAPGADVPDAGGGAGVGAAAAAPEDAIEASAV